MRDTHLEGQRLLSCQSRPVFVSVWSEPQHQPSYPTQLERGREGRSNAERKGQRRDRWRER